MAKSQGITVSPPAQQQGSKNVQTGRPQNILTLSLTKGNTTYDEFKHMMAYPLHPINGGEAIALMVMRASMEKELRLMKTRNISRKNWQLSNGQQRTLNTAPSSPSSPTHFARCIFCTRAPQFVSQLSKIADKVVLEIKAMYKKGQYHPLVTAFGLIY
ncbi:hypothetical protein GBA52_014396 [Prunus armeniaca]|nr:hypothetical protein GBA52_014396 [Prunus armeniaca]